MIDAIWFVFWLLIVPCAIVGWVEFLWSVYRDSRAPLRGATRRRTERAIRKEIKWLWS